MGNRDAEVKEVIAERYASELNACRRLQGFADSQWEPPWEGRPPAAEHELLIAAETAHAAKTFRAVITLVEVGFGEQAAMLNRGLFEGMAVAHWVASNSEKAVERYRSQSRHTRLLWAQTIRRLEWDGPAGALPEPKAGELEALGEMFGPYGTRRWTGHRNLPEVIREIEDQWDDQGRQQPWTFHDVAHRDNNLVLRSGAWRQRRARRSASASSGRGWSAKTEQVAPIGFGRATGRRAIYLVGPLGLFFPWLRLIWDSRRQALHDVSPGTLVGRSH